MPALTSAAVRKQIQSGATDPVYLLQGEDEIEKSALAADFADVVEEGLRAFNVERIHAGDWTTGDQLLRGVSEIIDSVRTLPMMAQRRVIIVAQAEAFLKPKRESDAAEKAMALFEEIIRQPEISTTLVIVAASLHRGSRIYKLFQKQATIVECGAPEDVAAAARWLRSRFSDEKVEIDGEAARLMAVLAGFPDQPSKDGQTGNVRRLHREVKRLLLYALGQNRISVDDVREVAGAAALQSHWALSNAVRDGDAAKALHHLNLMMNSGAVPVMILGQLGQVVRADFPKIAPAQLRSAVDALFRTDADLKRSAGDARILFERLVVELCSGKRSRRW